MMSYLLYGLILIVAALYVFQAFRKKGKEVFNQRRSDLKEVRQLWLDHQLGLATSDIILYGDFMDQKIFTLKNLGTDGNRRETYYIDEESGEKWVKEYVPEDDSMQLRRVGMFVFE